MGTKQDEIEQAFTEGFSDKPSANAELSTDKPVADPAAESTNLDPNAAPAPTAEELAAADPAAAPAADPWEGIDPLLKTRFDDLEARLIKANNIANSASGRANKLQSDLDKKLNAKPEEKPQLTSEQLLGAMTNSESREKLREDFGEFAAALDEIDSSVSTSVGTAMDKLKEELRLESKAINEQAVVDFEIKRNLDNKHPGWETTVQQDDFKIWAYEGGPSEQERLYYESLMANANQAQAADAPTAYENANNYYTTLINNHPVWANEKGNLYGNPSGDAAISLLDLYKKDKAPAPAAAAEAAAAPTETSTFENNLAPTSGKGQHAPQAPTEDVEKAFSEGFNT